MSSDMCKSVVMLLAVGAILFATPSALAQYPVQQGGIFCTSDLNRDLVVDAADLGILLSDWNGTEYDLDGNGTTDGGDIGYFLTQWNMVCHPFHDNMEVSIDGDFLVVMGSGLPDHPMGNFPGECGNPNTPVNQNDEWRLPLNPEFTKNPAIDVLQQLGPTGVWVNGVAFYNPYDGGGVDAAATICMDICNNHPSPDGRLHSHHKNPCLEPYSGGHSRLLGFAFDGIPVYGPYETDGVLADLLTGADALDGCRGHYDEDRGYHYHTIARDEALAAGIAGGGFPYILGCYSA